jgi:hypothetical protein
MKSFRILLLSICSCMPAFAEKHDSNGNLWLNYMGDHPIKDTNWSVLLEGQIRRAEMGGAAQQLIFRPGIKYKLSDSTSLALGYTFVETDRYGDYPVLHEFPEHRAWQQLAYTQSWLGLDWVHRFRLEQRWIGEMKSTAGDWDVANWRYENRFRYMLRTTVPLTESKNTYLALSNELFLNFGENVVGNDFDQNRAFIGIGQKINPVTRLEVGFLEQTLQRRGGKIWEHNHTIGLWLYSSQAF